MNKKLRLPLFCMLVLGLAGSASAQDPSLVGWWRLDDGAGTTATDSSGNGNDGEFVGAPTWVPGQIGQAVHFDGDNDWIEVPHNDILCVDNEVTVAAWIMPEQLDDGGSGYEGIITKGNAIRSYSLYSTGSGAMHFSTTSAGAYVGSTSTGTLVLNEWQHVSAQVKDGTQYYFINGAPAGTGGTGINLPGTTDTESVIIGNTHEATGRRFGGIIDDVRVYNRALEEDEYAAVMKGSLPTVAADPNPADQADDVIRDTMLTWSPGLYESTHDLYFGTSYEDVAGATVPMAAGLTVTSYEPGRLEFGSTYYWRVDEVNVTPDKTVYPGDVWSFTVEPYSVQIPVDVSNVTASSSAANNPPSLVVDESGLTGNTHSAKSEEMWLSASPDLAPWLMVEFNGVEKLDQMLIWNSNSSSEAFVGWGLKDVNIEYSVDGEAWTALAESTEIIKAPGLPTYDTPQAIDFGLVQAKYVRINILSNWGGLLMQYGIAELQFYGLPVQARQPYPASGAVDVVPDAVVTWRAGREAGQHTVYVGIDSNAVADGSAPSASSGTNSLDLSPFDLQMGTAYYWKVNEVNEAEVPAEWAGPVWSFDTAAELIVDDFESYGNLSPNRPFQTWTDGFGYSADEFFPVAYPGNGTGEGIGHDIWSPSSPHFGGEIMETVSTIPGSSQSMPFYFSGASETERTFATPQDWTVGNAMTLSIPFRGQADNTGTLYVKINDTKVTYPRDPGNIALGVWQAWNIDLASVNTNLQNVTKLAIGVDGNNANGMILIDDITLHAEAGELITPVQPADTGLVLHYTFDAGAGASIADASGQGNTGTFEILPQYDTGVSGGAASFNGTSNYINAPAAAWSSVSTQFTVSFWAKGAADLANNWGFFAGSASSRIVSCHLPWGPEVIFDTTPGWANERIIVPAAPDELRGQWRHWTLVRNTETGEKKVYMDGVLYGSTTPSADPIAGIDRFFIGTGDATDSPYMGLVDDFKIYNRALSAEEILWLAGVTTPIDKPF